MASVQILMAVYNGERYLDQQIESILNQSFQDWELLISDDCSTDRSLDVIRLYCERDSRIRLVLDGSHFGSAKSHFMALFRIASAPYVMTADQDDVWDTHKIELTLNKMKESEIKSSGPVLVCTDLRVVDQNLNLISPSFFALFSTRCKQNRFRLFFSFMSCYWLHHDDQSSTSSVASAESGYRFVNYARLVGVSRCCCIWERCLYSGANDFLSTAF